MTKSVYPKEEIGARLTSTFNRNLSKKEGSESLRSYLSAHTRTANIMPRECAITATMPMEGRGKQQHVLTQTVFAMRVISA